MTSFVFTLISVRRYLPFILAFTSALAFGVEPTLVQKYVQKHGYADVVTKNHLVTLTSESGGCGVYKLQFRNKANGAITTELPVPAKRLAAFSSAGLQYDAVNDRLWLMGPGCDGANLLLSIDVSQTKPTLHDYSDGLPQFAVISNYTVLKDGTLHFYGSTNNQNGDNKYSLCSVAPTDNTAKCVELTVNSSPMAALSAHTAEAFASDRQVYQFQYPQLGYLSTTEQLVLIYGQAILDGENVERDWYIAGIDTAKKHVVWHKDLPLPMPFKISDQGFSSTMFFGNYVAISMVSQLAGDHRIIYQVGSTENDELHSAYTLATTGTAPLLFGVQRDKGLFFDSDSWLLYRSHYVNNRPLGENWSQYNQNLILSFDEISSQPYSDSHPVLNHQYGKQIQFTSGAPSPDGSLFAAASLNLNGSDSNTGDIPNSLMMFNIAGELLAEAALPNTTGRTGFDNWIHYGTKLLTDQEGDAVAIYLSYQRAHDCDSENNCLITTYLGKWLYQ